MLDRKKKFLIGLYVMEMSHTIAAKRMASIEKYKDTKAVLRKIAFHEEKHARMWRKVINDDGLHVGKRRIEMSASWVVFMRKVLGVALTVKMIERFEDTFYNKMINASRKFKLSKTEKDIISRINEDEKKNMAPLERKVVEYNRILNNIKDVILGMNDGLVEVLAAVVGLAAALHVSQVVLVGGLIVGVSGTLSMAAGAYLSTEYEKSVGVRKDKVSRPGMSALYMGAFYAMGATVPLIPFIFGASAFYGIVSSIVLTSVMLTVASVFVAIISGTSIAKRISKTLLISIGVALVTILLGTVARQVFHIVI